MYKASYDLLLEIFRLPKNFSKENKYAVGEILKKETLDLITVINRVNIRTDKESVLQTAPWLISPSLIHEFAQRLIDDAYLAEGLLDVPRDPAAAGSLVRQQSNNRKRWVCVAN